MFYNSAFDSCCPVDQHNNFCQKLNTKLFDATYHNHGHFQSMPPKGFVIQSWDIYLF